MLSLLHRIHTSIKARLVKYFRTREVVKVFQSSHNQELRATPLEMWPLVQARQMQELQAIRAGRLDIVDRKSWAWPFLPASVTRLATPIIKATPYNLRRMSRTPIPRRAINLIKYAIIALSWDIEPIDDIDPIDDENGQKERIKIAKKIFNHPNNQDSYQTFLEQGIEDMLILGAFPAELRYTMDPERPIKMWPVNIESVRIFASWSESTPEMPHYAQMTGLKGERGAVLFYDDELLYVKDNPSTDNPFGLGKMEVAFSSINDFLGIQGMSGRAGADQVHKTWLWWEQPQSDAAYQIVRRHIQNELEGQAKISIVGGMKKPDVLEVNPVTIEDLLIPWQELLIRVIAAGFDLSAMSFLEQDINRAVGQVLDDKDFRSAVVPIATRMDAAFTRRILHNKLGWTDLKFRYLNLEDPDKVTMAELCSRMYSANSLTGNQFRTKMGMEKMESPFMDLTQFELMMINIEAMGRIQDQAADKASQRQMDQQKQMQDDQDKRTQDMQDQGYFPPPGGGQNGAPQKGGGLLKTTPGSMAKGGQPPSPKPMSLPKFPIAGSRWNAKQIAQMPVNHIADAMYTGQLEKSPKKLVQKMDEQEPGILDQMSDEVREFFEEALEREAQEDLKQKIKPTLLKQWQKDQDKRYAKQSRRIDDFSQWLYKKGAFMGRPGGGSSKGGIIYPGKRPAGKPGDINQIKRY